MPRERRRVHYSGRVQGVGFRFTSQHLARGFDVGGFVRNLEDGRVELVAEGESAEIEAFLESIRAALGRKIHSERTEHEPPDDPPLREFSIRY